MRFSEIPGQKEIIGKLVNTVNQGRVSHAQLFAGPEGCGSLAIALAYAQFVSCEDRLPGDSCGKCKSCIKYEKLIHPDLHFVFPVIKDKRSNEPVSDNYIEQWRDFVKQSPYFSLNNWLDSIEVGNAQGLIFASEASEIIRKLRNGIQDKIVAAPKVIIDCIEWNLTNLLSFSIRKNIRPVIQPAT